MTISIRVAAILFAALLGTTACTAKANPAAAMPEPAVKSPASVSSVSANRRPLRRMLLGCPGRLPARKGVISASSGYSGGSKKTAEYEIVSTGETGHAESVQIVYDPSQITYGELLRVFFSVAHDPTQLDRQGPDEGKQYRSSIFYNSDEQKRIAEAYIAQLDSAKVFPRPIVTKVVPLQAFYQAEPYPRTMPPYILTSPTSCSTMPRRWTISARNSPAYTRVSQPRRHKNAAHGASRE